MANGHREVCRLCWEVNRVGFHVPDDIWAAAVKAEIRDKVLCLACFARLADECEVEWDKYIKFYPCSYATTKRHD